ncbi:MAG: Microbial collagenase precursor [Syntrophorhabdaceae bacterium PtaU1.Bin034]|nr:MAG: Microbial collagenase precursor [Syntrophorhabdaceae bacterium PtaU1.Bin034]
MKKTFFFVLFMFSLLAFKASPVTAETKVAIFFANGMLNSIDAAIASQIELQKKVKDRLPSGVKAAFLLSYNENEWPLTQLIEVFKQKLQDWTLFWKWLAGSEGAPQWFKDAITGLAKTVDENTWIKDRDLENHVKNYNLLLKTRKVIVVAHSQGNFYANRAFGMVDPGDFSIVAAATPASYVAGNGPYTTLSTDYLITSIPGALLPEPRNLKNHREGKGFLGHSFVPCYLEGDVSGERIVQHMLNAIGGPVSTPSNQWPVAKIKFIQKHDPDWGMLFPYSFTFTSESYDPDGKIVKHEWDFGDGVTASGVEVYHKFPSNGGPYNVKLTVTDNNSKTAFMTLTFYRHTTYPIETFVTTEDGKMLSGVKIILSQCDENLHNCEFISTEETDVRGKADFNVAADGTYQLKASKSDYIFAPFYSASVGGYSTSPNPTCPIIHFIATRLYSPVVIAMTPMEGPPGTTFTEWGTGFPPNTEATLFFRKPDGSWDEPQRVAIDAQGHFEIQYTAPMDKPPGTYTWWASSQQGVKSNEVSYEIR